MPLINRLGESNYNKKGEKITIIEYINNQDISIQFEDGIIIKHRSYSDFKNGSVKHPIRYEETIGYYIEKELKLNINDIWNWDKNNENGIYPYETPQQSNKKIWLYCLKCDYHNDYGGYTVTCSHFYEGNRCSYCRKQNKLHPRDSLAYNYPKIAKMIAIPKNNLTFEDCYKISCHSNRKFYFKCLDCNAISRDKKLLSNIVKRGYSCYICGDRINIPEKFMLNILNQLKIDYILHLSKTNFTWCNNYEYDFYISSLNIIIETHGGQHYVQPGGNWGKLDEIKMNDLFKYKCAKNHIDNYIIIDCRYSELNWMKENIIKELSDYFDLTKVDWELAWEESQNSLCVKAWELWNSGIHDVVKIGDMLKINRSLVVKFLKRGVECDKCDYTIEESKRVGYNKNRGRNHYGSREVYCITIDKKFDSICEAEEYFGMGKSNISSCCNGEREHAGKLKDGTKLKWMYYEDYIKECEEKNE